MKVILTGATGFIGSEILSQLLAHPTITSIIAISRRTLPTSHPKLKTVLLEDFSKLWPSSVLEECAGAEACIWALGVASTDVEKNTVINRDYTLAGYNALLSMSKERVQKLRFVYMSGVLAEKGQEKTLWFVSEMRKFRGQVENQLVELGNQLDVVATYITRPGIVQKKDVGLVMGRITTAGGILPNIRVDKLAAATIGIATSSVGAKRQIWENNMLEESGAELLLKAF